MFFSSIFPSWIRIHWDPNPQPWLKVEPKVSRKKCGPHLAPSVRLILGDDLPAVLGDELVLVGKLLQSINQ